ncbi:hypothetical protein [Leuconostoc citreum]
MKEWELVKWLSANLSATNILLAIIALVLISYLTKSSDWLRDKFQRKNAQVLQIEQFYRQNSGEDLKGLLNEWLGHFNTVGKEFNADNIEVLVKQTLAVSSGKTTIILTSMLQHIYQNGEKKDDTYVLMIYFAAIVDSLKKDFTAEGLGIFVLIQSKINDFHKELPKYREAYSIYKKEIRKTKRGIGMPLTGSLIIIIAGLVILLALIIYLINKM